MNTSERTLKLEVGFTLIELMIVIAVIGILTLYSVPRFQGVKEQYRLEGSAQSVSAALKYAKQLAMDQRITTYVCLTESEVQVLKISTHKAEVVFAKPFDFGVRFDPNRSNHGWLTEVEDPETHAILGWGVSYNYQGFNQANGSIELSHNSGRIVQVIVADKTGYITISWP